MKSTHFGEIKEFSNEYYQTLSIKPYGFWSETVEAIIDNTGCSKWEGKIGVSSGAQEEYDPCKRARNQAYALVYASEWVEAKLAELNK